MLANLISHCLLPKAKKAHLVTVIRNRLERIARLLALSSGPDVQFLARGLASAPLVRSQRRLLPEIAQAGVDSKYGCVATPIGATAAIICAVSTLTSRANADWMKERVVLLSAFLRAESQLRDWAQMTSWDAEARSSIDAEQRAIVRAGKAVEVAIEVSSERDLDAMGSMRLQLAAAERAAYAPHALCAHTQATLLSKIEARELISDSVAQMEALPSRAWPQFGPLLTVVPLAALPADGSRVPMGSSSSESGSGWTLQSDTASVVSESSSWDEIPVLTSAKASDAQDAPETGDARAM